MDFTNYSLIAYINFSCYEFTLFFYQRNKKKKLYLAHRDQMQYVCVLTFTRVAHVDTLYNTTLCLATDSSINNTHA